MNYLELEADSQVELIDKLDRALDSNAFEMLIRRRLSRLTHDFNQIYEQRLYISLMFGITPGQLTWTISSLGGGEQRASGEMIEVCVGTMRMLQASRAQNVFNPTA